MNKREEVLIGFEAHVNGFCFSCPYNDGELDTTNCKRQLVYDAIDVLKNQDSEEVQQ